MKTQAAISKRLKVDKSESRLLMIVAVATIVTVFSLVSAKTLLGQAAYHKRVLDARRDALKQLEANIEAANKLVSQYQIFQTGNTTNIIGGKNSTDTNLQPPDGDNARLVLDALPSKYDFPALISSLAKILDNSGFQNKTIDGKDESGSVSSDPIANPKATTITLTVNGTANYQAVKNLIKDFERSTRPFDITKMDIKGTESNMAVTLTLNTYFQPALTLNLTTKEVK
ncbi:MAG TPA: hypothetical protein VIK37_01520 [Candidatus Saccharimonadales bacterium]